MKNMTYQLYLAKTRAHKLGLAKSNPDYFCMAHKLKWFLYFKRAFKGKEKKKKAYSRDYMPLAKPKIFAIQHFKKICQPPH